jgi:two-component system response regulator DegU
MHGHEVVESHNGIDAVESYAIHRPDCVLMDIEMEGMDGLAATRNIVQSDPEAKIIVVTMHDSLRLRRAASEAGARGYVVKENLVELPSILSRL